MSQAKKMVGRVCLVLGALLIADTLLVKLRSGWNLGVVLPALMGLPLLIYGLFWPRLSVWTEKGVGAVIKYIFLGGYVCLLAVFAIFIPQMHAAAVQAPPPGADAVIVLGAGLRQGVPSLTLKNRLDVAAEYSRQNPDALVVLSGGVGRGQSISEAQAMQEYLKQYNEVPGQMVLEEKSTSTQENFAYSKQLLDQQLGEDYRVVFATSDFHIMRAEIHARDAGLTATGMAAPTPLFTRPNNYMRESLALLFVHVRGHA